MKQSNFLIEYNFSKYGTTEPLVIRFEPVLPPGSEIESVWLDHKEITTKAGSDLILNFELVSEASLEIRLFRGVSVLPLICHPEPGQKSTGARIINHRFTDNNYDITIESENNKRVKFEFFTGDYNLVSVSGGSAAVIGENKIQLRIETGCNEDNYCRRDVRLVFEKKQK